jgi:hypothetical protein
MLDARRAAFAHARRSSASAWHRSIASAMATGSVSPMEASHVRIAVSSSVARGRFFVFWCLLRLQLLL